MTTSTWAKIAGWGQFVLQLFSQVGSYMSSPSAPHGAAQWIGLAGSLVTAVAIHGASATDGTK